MEKVCESGDGNYWYFEPENQKYFRIDKDGNRIARISGKYLPDPFDLWERRCKQYEMPSGTPNLKPQPTTFALWDHWQQQQQVSNVDNNN